MVLGEEIVLVVNRILLVIDSDVGGDKPFAGCGEGSVILTADTVFRTNHHVVAQFCPVRAEVKEGDARTHAEKHTVEVRAVEQQ